MQTDGASSGHDPWALLVEDHEGCVVDTLHSRREATLYVRVVVGALQAVGRRNVVVVGRHDPDDPGVHVLASFPDHPLAPRLRHAERAVAKRNLPGVRDHSAAIVPFGGAKRPAILVQVLVGEDATADQGARGLSDGAPPGERAKGPARTGPFMILVTGNGSVVIDAMLLGLQEIDEAGHRREQHVHVRAGDAVALDERLDRPGVDVELARLPQERLTGGGRISVSDHCSPGELVRPFSASAISSSLTPCHSSTNLDGIPSDTGLETWTMRFVRVQPT